MSFFKKLKDKLFKSSSKLEEGLDAIVEDGGEVEEAVEEPPKAEKPEPKKPAEKKDPPKAKKPAAKKKAAKD